MYTYREVVEQIQNARRFGNLSGIEVTKALLEESGHPERGIPFVHVAGTNGKGSVCAFLGNILSRAGYKTGIFTSPHLVCFEERIAINGIRIPKETVQRLGSEILQRKWNVHPTMFDYCLLMALMYFKEEACDLMILETGLGGRKDSTTAVGIPKVSVITKIGFDHMDILGNTLEQIAEEKAGILKKGTKLVIEGQEEKAMKVILAHARGIGIQEISIVSQKEIGWVSALPLGLAGVHQWENAAAAVLAARYLGTGFPEVLGQIEEGLKTAVWRGRMEILSEKPFLMVDGAHNGHGVRALKESLEQLYPGEYFHFIMGVMADKDYLAMIDELLPLAIDFMTVTPDSGRSVQGRELAFMIEKKGVPAEYVSSVQEVLRQLHKTEMNVAFGSLYFIGELIGAIHEKDVSR